MSTKFKTGDIIRSIDCLDNRFDSIVLCIMMTSKGYKYYIMEDVGGYCISSNGIEFIDKDYVLIGGRNADRTTDTRAS